MSLLLASVAVLVSLTRAAFPVPNGRHRRLTETVPRPWPTSPRRPEHVLDAGESRLVRPYVVAAEQADRRAELLLADLGYDGPGPYVIHGLEVA
ncbi:hypothetical protein [Streptomyces sp. NPDC050264]|uniref:hypothetical protein n=1 Tax=Streptomyces sp. NPDC050264 TaxID=3155038 RepID=UPI0034278362